MTNILLSGLVLLGVLELEDLQSSRAQSQAAQHQPFYVFKCHIEETSKILGDGKAKIAPDSKYDLIVRFADQSFKIFDQASSGWSQNFCLPAYDGDGTQCKMTEEFFGSKWSEAKDDKFSKGDTRAHVTTVTTFTYMIDNPLSDNPTIRLKKDQHVSSAWSESRDADGHWHSDGSSTESLAQFKLYKEGHGSCDRG